MTGKTRRIWEFGGFIAGGVLIVFGAVAIYMGASGFTTVRDSLKGEQIYFGSVNDPAVVQYAEKWGAQEGEERGAQVATGEQARAFAQIMRYHTINAEWNEENLTYSQMGRFLAADDPGNPKGTSDSELALKDESGSPVSNSFRNTWVTQTSLATALNMSYMAEQLSVFGLVVGIALLLTGVGLVIVAFAVFGQTVPVTASERTRSTAAPVTG